MQLSKAYEYINKFNWLQPYFEETVQHPPNEQGWMVDMLRNHTRYIAVRPIGTLDLNSTETVQYNYVAPKPMAGVRTPIDDLAFCITSPVFVKLTNPDGRPQMTEKGTDHAIKDLITYSSAAIFCYRFWNTQPKTPHFEYLPSTHSIAESITGLCARFGHTHIRKVLEENHRFDTLQPLAIVVSRQISMWKIGTIFRTFDIYDTPSTSMCYFCTGNHK
jgi:hypothetical protein